MAASFAELLRRFRVAGSLTQEALAERCGYSPATIAALETGRRRAPRLSTVSDLADALALSAADRALLATAAGAAGAARAAGPVAERRSPETGGTAVVAGRGGGGGRIELPAPITPLVGRLAEAGAVAGELKAERLVTLVGPGGVGKTRLALRVASGSADKFTGGIWWIELGPVTDPDGVASAVLRAVGGSEQPGAQASAEIVAALPDDPVLLVIDNCEHVLDAAAGLIGELLRSPIITVLATSREPLAIPGEVSWPVPPLRVPDAVLAAGGRPPGTPAGDSVESASSVEAVQLFVDRATRVSPGFRLDDGNIAAVARICRRLDGLPLGIELVAARIRARGIRELADDLDQRIPLAGATARGVPDRQSTLRAAIGWSYQLLTEGEQQAFRSLASFAGPFTGAAFAAVAGRLAGAFADEELTGDEALGRLVDKSLVVLVEETARYRLLQSIREYATQQAGQAGELAAIRDAHADYYAAWVAGLGAGEVSDASEAMLELIASEYPNLRNALRWSIDQRSARAASLVTAIGTAWHQLSMFHDAVVLGDSALGIVAEADPGTWARTAGALAMARLLAGDLAFVASAVPSAEQLARAADDHWTMAWCELVQGSRPPFDPGPLISAYERGVDLAPSVAVVAAASAASAGTDTDAARWSEHAIELAGRLDNTSLRAVAAVATAEHLIECGRLTEAVDRVLPVTLDRTVMPAVRLLAVGRVVHAAFQRNDDRVGSEVSTTVDEIARGWPDRGVWRVGLQGLRMALLRGEPQAPASLPREPSGWLMRIAHTPGLLRTYCRLAIDGGHRLDPVVLARSVVRPEEGSLMAASINSIHAACAAVDGDGARAAALWRSVLGDAARAGYLLLVCDALEALGGLAARRGGDPTLAVRLIAAGGACRDETGYRFRFGYEQAALDEAFAAVGPASPAGPALDWQAAAALALSG
jgi:predicted ATPase/DNA-binding XRE family transcriptional regulator